MKTIGVIGLGSIGLRHAKNLIALGHTVVGYDPDPDRRGKIPDQKAGGEDAFVIATPTDHHLVDAVHVASMKKPFFLEKPVGNKYRSVYELATMVGYNLRFHSCVKKAKEWIESGLVGKPLWANFSCSQYNAKPAYLRDGVILNWSHEIDLALYLLGGAAVSGSNTRVAGKNDDMTDILLTHNNGCKTYIHLDYITIPECRGFAIYCTKGAIFANTLHRVITFIDTNETTVEYHTFHDTSYDSDYREEMQAFVDRLDGKNTIGCSGKEGLRVLEICLEVRRQAGLE